MFLAARSTLACRRSTFVWACALVLLSAGAVSAATPRDELLRFVPEDVGFCFILQDFREQLKTLSGSPFAEQLDKSPIGQALTGSKEIKELLNVEKQLKEMLGLGWEQLRDDIFGDAVVFAFRPAPPGKPEQEQGLVLLRARDPKKLTALLEHINTAQKKSGQLKTVEECEHKGVKYFRRVEEKETNYYYQRDAVLVFSGQESILKEALERDRGTAADTEPPLSRRLRDAGLPRALFTAWINPRAFDDMLDAKTKESKVASDTAFLKTFATYWKATDSIFFTAALDKELSFSVAIQGRGEQLPAAARQLFQEAARPSDVWAAFPENALLATAGRVDGVALIEVLGDFMTKENRDNFITELNRNLGAVPGKNFVKEMLPYLGPDLGLALFAPPAKDKNWAPQAVFALRVGQGSDATAPVDQALVSTVKFFAQLVVLNHNRQNPERTMTLKTILQGKREVHLLAGDGAFPPGLQPSMTLANGYLILAGSPETIQQVVGALAQAGKAGAGEQVPLLRLGLKELRSYLKDRREPLTQVLMDNDKITQEEAHQRLDNMLEVLQFVDRLEIHQRSAAGHTTLTLSVQTALPLKK